MKRTMKLSIWGALIVIANQLNATPIKSSFDVTIIGSKTFELTINNLRGDVKISLLNEKNNVLYKQEFATNGSLKRTFDLGSFPDGNYNIELADSEKIQSFPISIEDNKLSIDTSERVIHFLPTVHSKNNIVRVNMPAFEEEYLEISIINSKNEIVYETKLKGKGNLGKVFDLTNTYSGVYEFLLISKAGFVSKEIVID